MKRFEIKVRLGREMSGIDATFLGVGTVTGAGIFCFKGMARGSHFSEKNEQSLGENEVWPSSWEWNKEQIEKNEVAPSRPVCRGVK